jgi:hypothetical protein
MLNDNLNEEQAYTDTRSKRIDEANGSINQNVASPSINLSLIETLLKNFC